MWGGWQEGGGETAALTTAPIPPSTGADCVHECPRRTFLLLPLLLLLGVVRAPVRVCTGGWRRRRWRRCAGWFCLA